MKQKISVIILCTLLLISVISAQTFELIDDFEVFSEHVLPVFQCAPASSSISIQNTGEVPSRYYISLAGDLAHSTTFSPGEFHLNPGEVQKLTQEILVPCNAKKSKLSVFIESDYGSSKELVQEIVVFKPNNIQVKVKNDYSAIQACQNAEYKLELVNSINFVEEYSLGVSRFKEIAKITPAEFTLAPGKSEEVTVLVEHNDCSQTGRFPFVLEIKTKNTQLTGEVDLTLEVSDDHAGKLELSDIKIYQENTKHKLKLSNTGSKKSTYELRTGSNWVSLDKKSISLEPQQSEVIELSLNAKEMAEGRYDINVVAILIEDAENPIKESFTVTVRKLTLISRYAGFIVSGGIATVLVLLSLLVILTNYFKSDKYKSKKSSRKKERLEKKLAGKSKPRSGALRLWFLSTLLIAVVLGGAWMVYTYSAYILIYKTYAIVASVVLAGICIVISLVSIAINGKEKSRISELSADKETKHSTSAEEAESNASAVDASQKESLQVKKNASEKPRSVEKTSFRWLCKIVSAAFILSAVLFSFYNKEFLLLQQIIQNNALNYKEYVLVAGLLIILAFIWIIKRCSEVKKKSWRFIVARDEHSMHVGWKVLHHVSFRLVDSIKKFTISCKKGKNEKFNIPPGEHIYHLFYIKLSEPEDVIDEITLHFKVKKNWIKNLNAEVNVVRFSHGEWKLVSVEQISEDESFAYFKAKTPTFGQFAVVGKEKGKLKEVVQKKPLVVLGVLFTVSFLLVLYLAFTQQSSVDLKGIPNQVWEKNKIHELDLNNYFSDPDGDELDFEAEGANKILVEFKDGIAVMTPTEENWTGSETIVFKATDDDGEFTSSNPVELKVVHSKWAVKGQQYWLQLVVGLLLILMIVSLIVYRNPLLKFLDEE